VGWSPLWSVLWVVYSLLVWGIITSMYQYRCQTVPLYFVAETNAENENKTADQ
jgi:hypothetical protein